MRKGVSGSQGRELRVMGDKEGRKGHHRKGHFVDLKRAAGKERNRGPTEIIQMRDGPGNRGVDGVTKEVSGKRVPRGRQTTEV